MRVIKKGIGTIILLVFLIGFFTAGIDYFRYKNGKIPIFQITSYHQKERKQTYQGILYQAERTITVSTNEVISESKNHKFQLILISLPISFPKIETSVNQLEVKENSVCNQEPTLYIEKENQKIYGYCTSQITTNFDKKTMELKEYLNTHTMEELKNKIDYVGLFSDGETMMFTSSDTKMYVCPNNTIIIGGKKLTFQKEMCLS